jgi:nitrate reductase gamma subunit
MAIAVYVAVYLGVLIFLVGCVRRIVQYATTPVHLRWELYPVPHEEPSRAAHGGSYFETAEWWKEPQRFSLSGELRAMIPEMLFLKGLWEFNRRLWYSSFLFHFGLYLTIASAVLVAISAVLGVLAPAVISGGFGVVLAVVYRWAGFIGTILTLVGATALLFRRTRSRELKNYTTAGDIFNLLFFIVTFALLGVGYALRPAGASVTRLGRGLVTLDASASLGPVFGLGLVLAAALAAYIPFTHMAHFIAKYFTYHAVRWDDRPNLRGGSLESRIAEYLTYRPTWAAAHVGADGKKNWAEIVTFNPAQDVRHEK